MTPANDIRVEAQLMIRQPADKVYQAFVDPAITTNFWFTKASGPLETGKTTVWEWEMYGVSSSVHTKELVPGKKIVFEWDEPATTVVFTFTSLDENRTYVQITNYGFQQTGAELIQAIKDNTGGFTTVLDGLKAWLEHGLRLNLIADKFPPDAPL